MNTAELIVQEAQKLPENLRIEVLNFINFLQKRHEQEIQKINTENASKKR